MVFLGPSAELLTNPLLTSKITLTKNTDLGQRGKTLLLHVPHELVPRKLKALLYVELRHVDPHQEVALVGAALPLLLHQGRYLLTSAKKTGRQRTLYASENWRRLIKRGEKRGRRGERFVGLTMFCLIKRQTWFVCSAHEVDVRHLRRSRKNAITEET